MDSAAVLAHWRATCAELMRGARAGAPTAFAVTLRWAEREVEWAEARNVQPWRNVPPHLARRE